MNEVGEDEGFKIEKIDPTKTLFCPKINDVRKTKQSTCYFLLFSYIFKEMKRKKVVVENIQSNIIRVPRFFTRK